MERQFTVVHYYKNRLSSEPFCAKDWPSKEPIPQIGATICSYADNGKYAHYRVKSVKHVLNDDHTALEIVILAYKIC